MAEAVIGLGSNVGDRLGNLTAAVRALHRLPDTRVCRCSGVYETAPVDCGPEAGPYLNACVVLETERPPAMLLGACLGIEAALGRERPYRNAPRTVDLDLLLFAGVTSEDPALTLPHPRLTERAFVMVPLRDLYPDGQAPGLNFLPYLRAVGTAGVAETTARIEVTAL